MASRCHTLLPPFKCGHPRSDDNLKPSESGYVCRKCARAANRRYQGKPPVVERHRRRHIVTAAETVARKLAKLENEARALNLTELLADIKHVNREWDKTIQRARMAAKSQGGSIGFGEARRGVDEL
jgi:hypothetical protein